MSKVGFIKDWRQELESDIWLMPPMYHRVWQWIKYSVNHSTGKIPNKDGTFTLIEPGQHATSYRLIAQGVGYYEGRKWKEPNVKTIKSILDWLVKQNMISVQSNSKGTIITVVNWGLYQSEVDKGNSERIAEETLEKHLVDTKKNVKNVKNDKKLNNNIISRPETPYEEIVNLYNTICISFNSIKQITDKRKGNINARYQESKCSIEVFKILFTKMQDSNFLKGGWDSGGKADFDWVMRPTNFVKVLEGKYDNKNQKQQTGNKQSNLSELMEMIEGGVFDE